MPVIGLKMNYLPNYYMLCVLCVPHRLEGGTSTLFSLRSLTPHSHTDSGVEEQEDTAMVPAETLCELLRRTFKLSPEKFNQYEDLIAGQIQKKSPQKVIC